MGADRERCGDVEHDRGLNAFEAEWARCLPWLEAANAYGLGTHDMADVKAAIALGEAQFWPGQRSAVVTEFHEFPRLKVLHFWLCGGDLDELIGAMRPEIETWGARQGCTRFTTAGRSGWQRVMAAHGYRPQWHICAKDI